MAKSMETNQFMQHVVTTIQRQLKLWDERYEISLLQDMLGQDFYVIVVNLEDKDFQVILQCMEVERLQGEGPYTLDRYIWRRLVDDGLVIKMGEGNYLDYCAI